MIFIIMLWTLLYFRENWIINNLFYVIFWNVLFYTHIFVFFDIYSLSNFDNVTILEETLNEKIGNI